MHYRSLFLFAGLVALVAAAPTPQTPAYVPRLASNNTPSPSTDTDLTYSRCGKLFGRPGEGCNPAIEVCPCPSPPDESPEPGPCVPGAVIDGMVVECPA